VGGERVIGGLLTTRGVNAHSVLLVHSNQTFLPSCHPTALSRGMTHSCDSMSHDSYEWVVSLVNEACTFL